MNFQKKAKIILSILALAAVLIITYYAVLGNAFYTSLAGTEENAPKATLYISSTNYKYQEIVETLDKLKSAYGLVKRDWNQENKDYPYFGNAIFYSLPRTTSMKFGVFLTSWSDKTQSKDRRYIVNIYSNVSPCKLCEDTLKILNEGGIEFSNE